MIRTVNGDITKLKDVPYISNAKNGNVPKEEGVAAAKA
jgi:O-acetyl-ADP-ribose deacetylase (regulator of RNase III)